jgi:predicted transcriptional regulator
MQKEKVLQVLDTFAEDVDLDTFLETVYLMEKIETGEKQILAGEVTSHEEAKQRLKKWLD